MKKVFFTFCFIMAICTYGNANTNQQMTGTGKTAEDPGTVFFDMTLEEALEKAKSEDKYVLINFHTKTCGPCRKMEKTVFPTPECGNYVNKHFVPIMIDGEDGGTGQEIAKKYKIFIFPTYLVLLPDGGKEGEVSGAEFDVNKFLDMLKYIIHDL